MRHCLTLRISEVYLISFVHSLYTLEVFILAISPNLSSLLVWCPLYIPECHVYFSLQYFFIKRKKVSLPDVHLLAMSLISHVCVLSHVWLFVIPWTAAHGLLCPQHFPGQEYWSRLPFPPPGQLPNLGAESTSLVPPALACRFFTTDIIWHSCKCLNYGTTKYHLGRHIPLK